MKEDLLWEIYLIRTARSDVALFSREDHFCHLFLHTLVNVLFLHKPVQILLVGLFLNILPNWNFFVIQIFCRIFRFINQRLHFFIKKFKHYSCFKAKRLNYSICDSNWKNKEFNLLRFIWILRCSLINDFNN